MQVRCNSPISRAADVEREDQGYPVPRAAVRVERELHLRAELVAQTEELHARRGRDGRRPGRLGEALGFPFVIQAIIDRHLKSLLLGENALQTEVIWERMARYLRDTEYSGLGSAAMSGDRSGAVGSSREGARTPRVSIAWRSTSRQG